jgi:hypothetical protein
MRGKVLLVEFKYHQEIIPSQLLMLLDGGYEVHVFLAQSLWDDQLLGPFRDRVSFTLLPDTKKIVSKVQALFRLRRYINRHGITHLVVNTLDSNFNYYVLKFNPNVHAIGIVHQVHRFVKKKSHLRSLRKVRGIATLSDFTLDFFKKHFTLQVRTAYFYPIYFKTDTAQPHREKKEIGIVVPGQLDLKKRDYFQLIHALEHAENLPDIKFYLLGNKNRNDGPAVAAAIESKGLSRYFYVSDGFLPYDDFFSIIRSSDYVMPLLSSSIPNYNQYLQSQISASFNWGYAFRKKLLLHVDFEKIVKGGDAVFYTDSDLPMVLRNLQQSPSAEIVPEHLAFTNQQASYLSLFSD